MVDYLNQAIPLQQLQQAAQQIQRATAAIQGAEGSSDQQQQPVQRTSSGAGSEAAAAQAVAEACKQMDAAAALSQAAEALNGGQLTGGLSGAHTLAISTAGIPQMLAERQATAEILQAIALGRLPVETVPEQYKGQLVQLLSKGYPGQEQQAAAVLAASLPPGSSSQPGTPAAAAVRLPSSVSGNVAHVLVPSVAVSQQQGKGTGKPQASGGAAPAGASQGAGTAAAGVKGKLTGGNKAGQTAVPLHVSTAAAPLPSANLLAASTAAGQPTAVAAGQLKGHLLATTATPGQFAGQQGLYAMPVPGAVQAYSQVLLQQQQQQAALLGRSLPGGQPGQMPGTLSRLQPQQAEELLSNWRKEATAAAQAQAALSSCEPGGGGVPAKGVPAGMPQFSKPIIVSGGLALPGSLPMPGSAPMLTGIPVPAASVPPPAVSSLAVKAKVVKSGSGAQQPPGIGNGVGAAGASGPRPVAPPAATSFRPPMFGAPILAARGRTDGLGAAPPAAASSAGGGGAGASVLTTSPAGRLAGHAATTITTGGAPGHVVITTPSGAPGYAGLAQGGILGNSSTLLPPHIKLQAARLVLPGAGGSEGPQEGDRGVTLPAGMELHHHPGMGAWDPHAALEHAMQSSSNAVMVVDGSGTFVPADRTISSGSVRPPAAATMGSGTLITTEHSGQITPLLAGLPLEAVDAASMSMAGPFQGTAVGLDLPQLPQASPAAPQLGAMNVDHPDHTDGGSISQPQLLVGTSTPGSIAQLDEAAAGSGAPPASMPVEAGGDAGGGNVSYLSALQHAMDVTSPSHTPEPAGPSSLLPPPPTGDMLSLAAASEAAAAAMQAADEAASEAAAAFQPVSSTAGAFVHSRAGTPASSSMTAAGTSQPGDAPCSSPPCEPANSHEPEPAVMPPPAADSRLQYSAVSGTSGMVFAPGTGLAHTLPPSVGNAANRTNSLNAWLHSEGRQEGSPKLHSTWGLMRGVSPQPSRNSKSPIARSPPPHFSALITK
eukprot:jgi/Chrzof1/11471/Cz05g37240.t1